MAAPCDEASDVGLSTQGLSIVHGSICVMSHDRLTWCARNCIIMKLQLLIELDRHREEHTGIPFLGVSAISTELDDR